MIKRARIDVFGKKIQKAGYRERVTEIAEQLELVGTVWNSPDGRVEIICEGEEDRIKDFIGKIKLQEKPQDPFLPAISVDDLKTEWDKPTGEFKIFTTIYKESNEILLDLKSDVWAAKKIMTGMASYQQKTFEGIETLTDHTDKNFTSMESKYHKISIVTYALLFTISTFAVFGTLLYLNAIPRSMVSFAPVLVMNTAAWIGVIYLTVKKRNVALVTENV